MASIRHKNLRLVIYPNDHGPPHAHVIGPDFEVKANLIGRVRLDPKQLTALSAKERRECLLAIRDHRHQLIRIWSTLHGSSQD